MLIVLINYKTHLKLCKTLSVKLTEQRPTTKSFYEKRTTINKKRTQSFE